MRTILLVLTLLAGIAHADSKEISIGAIASLSGPAAEQGKNWLEGATLAAEELTKAGQPVRLVVEDDLTRPANVASAFAKLATIDKVSGIIGGTFDFLAEAAYPLAARHKVPFVTPTNPVEILSEAATKNPWVFTTGLSIASTTEAIRRIIDMAAPRSAAILVPNVPFGTAHTEVIERLLGERKIPIVFSEAIEFAGFLESLKAAARRVKERNPDFVFCLAEYGALDVFTTELERMRVTPTLVTTQHLDAAFELSGKNRSRYARAHGIYPAMTDPKFAERYSKRFGHPPRVYAGEGYDALKFLVALALVRKDEEPPRPGFSSEGVTGRLEIRGESRALTETPAVILRLNGEELKPLALPTEQ